MQMGKRHRPPMKRTTSMKDVAGDLSPLLASAMMPSDQETAADAVHGNHLPKRQNLGQMIPGNSLMERLGTSGVFPAATFLSLSACALCNSRLGPDRDIFVYRGEMAFCSSECRELLINHDERKEKTKCFLSSMKNSAQGNASSNSGVRMVPT